MQTLLDKVEVTEFRPEDTAFVQDTWAQAYRVAEECKDMPKDAYHLWHRPRREFVLNRPGTIVLVARDRNQPLWIAGYGVFERVGDTFVAHWVYCKKHCKQQGVGGRILTSALDKIGTGTDANPPIATHRTWFGSKAEDMGFVFKRLEDLYGQRIP